MMAFFWNSFVHYWESCHHNWAIWFGDVCGNVPGLQQHGHAIDPILYLIHIHNYFSSNCLSEIFIFGEVDSADQVVGFEARGEPRSALAYL